MLGSDRHELVCSACGAPLRQLKSLPAETAARTPVPLPSRGQLRDRPKRKPKSKKKRKSWLKDLFEDAFDELGDLFD
ncbi:hypothetical protein [Tropicimonas aquimaris]|uniref:Uncharacterized protein n=1 Tax=Tropicimonas aquimaris TaxID=914152 RepID=A0ABW3ISY9_9RHOB